MKQLLKKGFWYINQLTDLYNFNAELSDCFNNSGICMVEKLQIVTGTRLYSEFYKGKENYSDTLYFSPQKHDFFPVKECDKESDDQYGIIANHEYDYRTSIESMINPSLDHLFQVFVYRGWDITFLNGNIAEVYIDFVMDKDTGKPTVCNDTTFFHTQDELEEIFAARSLEEKLYDFDVLDFFCASDREQSIIADYFSELSSYFSYDEYVPSSGFILIKSKLLPIFWYHIDFKKLSEADKCIYLTIQKCSSLLYIDEFGLPCSGKALEYAYYAFYVECNDDNTYNSTSSFGSLRFDPRLTIVPYIINEGITYLNNKYHFAEVTIDE